MVPKQCATFVDPAKAPTMRPMASDYGGYAIQAGGGTAPKDTTIACGNTTSALPVDADSYYAWRGHEGDGSAMGSSVPKNFAQSTQDWFNGKSDLYAPSRFDATTQNQAHYFTNGKGSDNAMMNMPTMTNSTVDVPLAAGNSDAPATAATFAAPYLSTTETPSRVPLFRAGKSRRSRSRRVRRARKARWGGR